MGSRGQQLRRRDSLAATVSQVAKGLSDVISVSVTNVRGCRGEQKVKLPRRWPLVVPTTLAFNVFDCENGNCEVLVKTTKPWAIAGAVERRLRRQGVTVC